MRSPSRRGNLRSMSEIEGSGSAVLLAGFVEGSDSVLDRAFFASMASRLAAGRWPVGPPEEAAPPDSGIGVRLPLPGASIEVEMERAALEAATLLIEELAAATEANDAVIAVEYDGEVVGWIANGQPDEGVRTGLLGEWRRALDG